MNIIVLLFLAVPFIFAQRVDIDRMYFSLKTRHFPTRVLSPEYKTYSVGISTSVSIERYTNESFNNKINIVGLKREHGLAHLRVNIKLDDLLIESSEVKERVEIIKDKDGKETGRKYYYHAEVAYSFLANASVTDYKTNTPIGNYLLSRRDSKKVYSTSEYSSYKAAADFYNNNQLEIKTSLINEQINQALSGLNSSLNKEFGYGSQGYTPHVWYVDSKKHPEYQASQDACNAVKAIFSNVIAEDSMRIATEDIQKAISYFEKLPSIYKDPNEKVEKKIRYMAYYNLAMIYYCLDEPKTALIYGQKIMENDYDTSDAKFITRESDELVENFTKHNLTTRHYPIDIDSFEPPK